MEDETWETGRAGNLAWWDERATSHAEADTYDIDAILAGGDGLRPWEPSHVGDVTGLDLVHLQCHIGTDTIGWARRGANVVGLDFSEPALVVAADLAKRCDLDMEWVQSDVMEAAAALGGRTFDVVYTGIGALTWLGDLPRWAAVVASLLRPGGMLYLYEIHPMANVLQGDGKTLCAHAIGAPFMAWPAPAGEEGSYARPDLTFAHTTTWERDHTISDVIGAVLGAGLTLDLFEEFDSSPAPRPWSPLGDDGLHRVADGMFRFPLTYALRARSDI